MLSAPAEASVSATLQNAGWGKRWHFVFLMTLVVGVAAMLTVFLGGFSSSKPQGLFGVRLGLSASDVRARFTAPNAGSWTSLMQPEPTLRWTSSFPQSELHGALFEFHQGMLVAARFDLDRTASQAHGALVEATRASVLERTPLSDGAIRVSLLSRDCPLHTEEVKRVLQTTAAEVP